MIKHHSAFKNKGILIVKPKLPQKYILMGKALIHKKKYKLLGDQNSLIF